MSMPDLSDYRLLKKWSALSLAVGTTALVAILVAGTAILVGAADRDASQAARGRLERAAQSVENTLNRQLLQVDGALASLPEILADIRGTTLDPGIVSGYSVTSTFRRLPSETLYRLG